MFLLTFPSGADWYKANWIFRQLKQDVIEAFPNDKELNFVVEQGAALGGLSLETMEKDNVSRALYAIKKVAEATVSGEIPGWKGTKPEDKDGQRIYLESISELLTLTKKEMERIDQS